MTTLMGAGELSPDPLLDLLEADILPRVASSADRVADVHRAPSPFASSYRAEVVEVRLESGAALRLFLKDLGYTTYPKDELHGRRERELHAYRDLLGPLELGTPRYHGCVRDEREGRFWLLLEFVEGEELGDRPLPEWTAGAAWLGALHRAERLAERLETSGLLMRHDPAFFERRVDAAHQDVAPFGRDLADRLRGVTDRLRALVGRMTDLPPCLVHGCYRPANVLVADEDGRRRISPVDWELAAVGSPLYDLATLVDGFEAPELDLMLGAYAGEAVANGASVPEHDELRLLVDCFRLHRIVNVLSRAQRSGFSQRRVAKLLGRAEALAEALRRAGRGSDRSAPSCTRRSPGAPVAPELVDGADGQVEALSACLQDVLAGRFVQAEGTERLKSGVWRLRFEVDGAARVLVVKRSSVEAARRNRLVARRWLPAVRLESLGPPVVEVAIERGGEVAWQVLESLPASELRREQPARPEVEAAIEAIARVHTAFVDHPLLPECRLWGGDRGIGFYAASVRDALAALRRLELGPDDRGRRAREALLERLSALEGQTPERAALLSTGDGAETLLHGDLWTTNVLVEPGETGMGARIIDWDEAAVGPALFDLSTFLLRFAPPERPWILDAYREAVDRLAGWRLPDEPDLNASLATAAYARLASLLVWSLAAAEEAPGWVPDRLAEVVEWLDEVEPVVPS